VTNIIFDFDGTIADSLPLVVNMVNHWLKKRHPIDEAELKRLRNLPIHKVIEELEIPPWKAPSLLVRGRMEMTRHINDVPIFDGIVDAINQLKAEDHTIYIMSSNSTKNIRKFLKHHGLYDDFKRIYGGIGIFGKTKALKKVMRDNKLSSKNTFYIGDEVRDVHAAHKAKVSSVAVSWGYNGVQLLSSEKPTAIAKVPADLVKILS
jgi:phosphoglycolate phosphatase